jgi:hypothetical protein
VSSALVQLGDTIIRHTIHGYIAEQYGRYVLGACAAVTVAN